MFNSIGVDLLILALVEEGGYTEEEARAIAIDMGDLEDEGE